MSAPAVNTLNAYAAGSYSCAQCRRFGEQIWIDLHPKSAQYGLCQHCRNPEKETMNLVRTPTPDVAEIKAELAPQTKTLSDQIIAFAPV